LKSVALQVAIIGAESEWITVGNSHTNLDNLLFTISKVFHQRQ